MQSIGNIIGLPLKIFSAHRIYIPIEYLRFYGISEKHDRLLLLKSEHSLFYQSLPQEGPDYSKKETISIRVGLTPLPIGWVRQNALKRGDTVFLLGTTDGLLLYVRK